MAGARRAPRVRAPRVLDPPRLPVLLQASGERRRGAPARRGPVRPGGLRCLHCRRGLRRPGRAHPPAGSRGRAAARRARAGGGAGNPPLPPCREGRRHWEPGELRQLRGGGGRRGAGGVAPRSLRWLRPVAGSVPQELLQQPPPREQPPPPSAPHGPPHPRPEAAPRGFGFPRWSVSPPAAELPRREGVEGRAPPHAPEGIKETCGAAFPTPPPASPALPLAPLSLRLSPLCRGAIRNQAALV